MTRIERAGTGPAAFPAGQMTEAAFRALYERLCDQVSCGVRVGRGDIALGAIFWSERWL